MYCQADGIMGMSANAVTLIPTLKSRRRIESKTFALCFMKVHVLRMVSIAVDRRVVLRWKFKVVAVIEVEAAVECRQKKKQNSWFISETPYPSRTDVFLVLTFILSPFLPSFILYLFKINYTFLFFLLLLSPIFFSRLSITPLLKGGRPDDARRRRPPGPRPPHHGLRASEQARRVVYGNIVWKNRMITMQYILTLRSC